MKFKILFLFSIAFYSLTGHSQTNDPALLLDTSLAKKITVSGFCLCQTSLSDLKKLTDDFKAVDVEEMNLPKNCYGQDGRFENGKGYYSNKFPGIVFQKDQSTDEISKIRLTKEFKGNLPEGTPIDLKNLQLKDVFKIYPKLKDTWGSRGCSNYWNFANDTLFFYVKIDTTKKPQFPIDEAYYYDKPIEAVDLLISCYRIFEKKERYKQLFNDPVFFIDSVNVTKIEMQEYQPTDIAVVTVYKDTNAIKLVGSQGKFGAVYVETKKFARNKYWSYFKIKSSDYFKAVPTLDSEQSIVYILNGKVLEKNFEGDLSGIDDKTFKELTIIDKDRLKKEYHVSKKAIGVVIKTVPKDKTD